MVTTNKRGACLVCSCPASYTYYAGGEMKVDDPGITATTIVAVDCCGPCGTFRVTKQVADLWLGSCEPADCTEWPRRAGEVLARRVGRGLHEDPITFWDLYRR